MRLPHWFDNNHRNKSRIVILYDYVTLVRFLVTSVGLGLLCSIMRMKVPVSIVGFSIRIYIVSTQGVYSESPTTATNRSFHVTSGNRTL